MGCSNFEPRRKKCIDVIVENAIKKIQQEISFSEFHFTEIYSGKNDFKGVDC